MINKATFNPAKNARTPRTQIGGVGMSANVVFSGKKESFMRLKHAKTMSTPRTLIKEGGRMIKEGGRRVLGEKLR
jgi:hypothetical protein